MIAHICIVVLLLVIGKTSGKSDFSDYAGTCSLLVDAKKIALDGLVALFSRKSFDLTSDITVSNDNFCVFSAVLKDSTRLNYNTTIVVRRGDCSFEQKTIIAVKYGYRALIIASSTDLFPMGANDNSFVSAIPVMMTNESIITIIEQIQRDFSYLDSCPSIGTLACSTPQSSVIGVQLQFAGIAHSNTIERRSEEVRFATTASDWHLMDVVLLCFSGVAIVIGGLVVIVVSQFITNYITFPSVGLLLELVFRWSIYISIICLFVGCRLGTFRTLQSSNDDSISTAVEEDSVFSTFYNHREGDELIFEALINSVLNVGWKSYSLRGHPIVSRLRLAPENYGDSLFIHPPIFVYFSACLHKLLLVPLPLIPIILQLISLLCVPVFVSQFLKSVNSNSNTGDTIQNSSNQFVILHRADAVSTWAVLFLAFCPLAAFVSQKFWIDNCALMAVTVSATAHVCLTAHFHNCTNNLSVTNSAIAPQTKMRHFVSGFFFFGGLALNTKITCGAILPFLICWTIYQRAKCIRRHALRIHQNTQSGVMGIVKLYGVDVGWHILSFSLGSVLAHGPWAWLYWCNTGRIFPNAWPSATMIAQSPYLQAALRKPWYTYFYQLLVITPVHALGLWFAFWCCLVTAAALIKTHCSSSTSSAASDTNNTRSRSEGADSLTLSAAATSNNSITATKLYAESASLSLPNLDNTAAHLSIVSEQASSSNDATATGHSSPASWRTATGTGTSTASRAGAAVMASHAPSTSHYSELFLALSLLALWPAAFIASLTFLGYMGAGYQTRFLLPIVPATSILAGCCLELTGDSFLVYRQIDHLEQQPLNLNSSRNAYSTRTSLKYVVMGILLGYCAMLCLYYGVMFAPLYADVDHSLVDILNSILSNPFFPPPTRDFFVGTLRYIAHFGVNRQSS